ncbi:MAG: plasmid mobilization protein [Nocardioidaceae bacterium]
MSEHEMTEAEEAEYLYAHRDDPELAGEVVESAKPERLDAIVSVRFSLAEERRVRETAQAAGMSVSAFLRQCALTSISSRVVDIERLRRDMTEVRSRIDDAWEALG